MNSEGFDISESLKSASKTDLSYFRRWSLVVFVRSSMRVRVKIFFTGLVISVKDKFTLQKKLMYKKNKLQTEKITKLKFDQEQKQVC